MAPTGGPSTGGAATATANAIAQAGSSGQAFVNSGQTAFAFSTGLPDKSYATMLIDGASNVANALLGPRDEIFGTGILGANYAADGVGESFTYSSSSTFDFARQGGAHPSDLLLGLIDGEQTGFMAGSGFQSMTFDIIANGVEIVDATFRSLSAAESFFRDDVIDLGPSLGPNVDLTIAYSLMANGTGGVRFRFCCRWRGSRALDMGDDAGRLRRPWLPRLARVAKHGCARCVGGNRGGSRAALFLSGFLRS
jgi:hypothetical protein